MELRTGCGDTLGFPMLHSFGPLLTKRVETEMCVCVCNGEGALRLRVGQENDM